MNQNDPGGCRKSPDSCYSEEKVQKGSVHILVRCYLDLIFSAFTKHSDKWQIFFVLILNTLELICNIM